MKKVCVIGQGVSSLPTALLAAQAGLKVSVIDIEDQFKRTTQQDMLCEYDTQMIDYTMNPSITFCVLKAAEYTPADYFVITVPGLISAQKKSFIAQLSSIAVQVATVLKSGDTIIVESAVPFGVIASFTEVISHESGLVAGQDFFVAYCPEPTSSSNYVFNESKVHDRIIGGINKISAHQAAQFYNYFVSGDLYLTTVSRAEMIKFVESSFIEVSTAFSNMVADVAAQEGLDPYEIIEFANKNSQISIIPPTCNQIDHPADVDAWFLTKNFERASVLLKTAYHINEERIQAITQTIIDTVTEFTLQEGRQPTLLVLGMIYKPDLYHCKESTALKIVSSIIKAHAVRIFLSDPWALPDQLPTALQQSLVTVEKGIAAADIIIGLVPHEHFRTIDQQQLEGKKILDFCGLFYTSHSQSIEQEQFFRPAQEMVDVYPESETQVPTTAAKTLSKESS